MNNILSFGKFEVQYWINEFPKLAEVSTLMSCETFLGNQHDNCISDNMICIEVFLHKNADCYGLLGFNFKPNINFYGLNIEIEYTEENTESYQSKIGPYDIYSGLTEEYVPYIKNKIIDKFRKSDYFYNGSLIVSCAANSLVGSSPKMFERITDVIIEFFFKLQEKEGLDLNECLINTLLSCGFFKDF